MSKDHRPRITRVLGAMGGIVAFGLACFEVWWFYGFTNFYFPAVSINGALFRAVLYLLVCAYFVAVAISARWRPWKNRETKYHEKIKPR